MNIASALAANLPTDEWNLYEYKISVSIRELADTYSEDVYELNEIQINGLMVEKDYDNDHLPVIIIKLDLPVLVHKSIMSTTEFVLVVEKYVVDEDNPDCPMERSIVISDVFYQINKDTTPDIDKSFRDKLLRQIGANDTDYIMEDMGSKYTYILIKKSDYISARTIVNAVIPNCDLTSAIAHLLTASGVKKALLSNLDNTDVIKELFLLPIPMLSNLIYLENYYGFHKEGTQIFMDTDVMYITRMSGTCTAWQDGESQQVTFFIGNPVTEDGISQGSIETDNTVYINIDKNSYATSDKTDVLDNLVGQNMLLVNEESNTVSDVNNGGSVYSMKTFTGHNKYIESQTQIRIKERSQILTIMCTYCDISVLTPNKKYNVITDLTNIIDNVLGLYRISRVYTTFMKEADHYINATSVTLKRVSGTE